MKFYLCLTLLLLPVVVFGTKSVNKTCNEATYHVQQLYQACPPKGPIVQTNPSGNDNNNPRLDTLEEKYQSLESMYRELNAKVGAGCGSSGSATGGNSKPNTVYSRVNNVTKSDGSYPKDCSEIFDMGYHCTGIFLIKPINSTVPFQAFCELSYEGWTVLMRRFDGSVDFFRNWNDYKRGFGVLSGEHWIGNDHIHLLTSQKNYELRIEFTYWTSKLSYYADYARFKIESEANKYKLHLTGYTGSSGYDGFTLHNNKPFSTWDRDNDSWPKNCAQQYKGAYWYTNCHNYAVPTGMYKASCSGQDCMQWKSVQALNAIIMKVKPI